KYRIIKAISSNVVTAERRFFCALKSPNGSKMAARWQRRFSLCKSNARICGRFSCSYPKISEA
ncbi:hypothetical protein, partial [Serratia marcescens]|uniref:hypothetical protein n=1 Tax=Serratia marcescens TaxID=615 RepID=UPI00195540B9